MKPKIRVSAIIIDNKKILMLLGKGYPELWTPGGKIEVNERDEDCLRRELHEEIGVTLQAATFFKEYSTYSFYDPAVPLIERVYLAKVTGELKPAAEIESIYWYTKEDLKNSELPIITFTRETLLPELINEGIW